MKFFRKEAPIKNASDAGTTGRPLAKTPNILTYAEDASKWLQVHRSSNKAENTHLSCAWAFSKTISTVTCPIWYLFSKLFIDSPLFSISAAAIHSGRP